MIYVDTIWTNDNGLHGIVDFTVVASGKQDKVERRLPVRALEGFDHSIKFVNEDRLNEFVEKHSDDPDETIEWLRRMLAWHLAFHRSPALELATTMRISM
jgi:hypothetical protein